MYNVLYDDDDTEEYPLILQREGSASGIAEDTEESILMNECLENTNIFIGIDFVKEENWFTFIFQ